MERLQKLEEKIKEGGMLTSEEALWLLEEAPFEELCEVAHRITVAYASRKFDMCSIINAKSGRCLKTANGVPSRYIITRVWRSTDW